MLFLLLPSSWSSTSNWGSRFSISSKPILFYLIIDTQECFPTHLLAFVILACVLFLVDLWYLISIQNMKFQKKKINFYAFYTCISYRFFIMEVLVNISLWLSFVTLDWTSCLGLCLVCWRGWGVHSFYFTHERLISVSNNNSHNKVIVIVIVLSLKEVKELLLRMYNEIYSYLC